MLPSFGRRTRALITTLVLVGWVLVVFALEGDHSTAAAGVQQITDPEAAAGYLGDWRVPTASLAAFLTLLAVWWRALFNLAEEALEEGSSDG